ncbi:unnamed protein product [Penicillium bialowiezense]
MASESPRPLGIEVPRSSMESPPGIAALFLISFDVRTGYVVSWKRTAPGGEQSTNQTKQSSSSDTDRKTVDIEGVVEYKSLPSGLHNVTEDLVYFVHEQYAGISAFLNHPAAEAERNAKMFAIGVLVPLSTGRLGKSWRHAPRLKELTRSYADNMSDMDPLSKYWDAYRIGGTESSAPESPMESPLSLRSRPGERPDTANRTRAFSDALVLDTFRPALTPFHPASSLPDFLDSFGPLVFPLYRAALLRKRILFMGEVPVQTPCNYASLPNSLLDLLPADRTPPLRPRPLFNVGIHDIHYLSTFDSARSIQDPETDPSWIACSTDTVLTMKPSLFDTLVTLPAPHTKQAEERTFPKLTLTNHANPQHPFTLKATQRDARRYAMLRRSLHHLTSSDTDSTYSSSPVVEPVSWTRLAYTSFMWWASAGENRDGLTEEEEEAQLEQDSRLLTSVENLSPQNDQPPEVALVAYFRRMTALIFGTLAGVIARSDDGDAEYEEYIDEDESESRSRSMSIGDEAPLLRQRSGASSQRGSLRGAGCEVVTISVADMTEMGLDVWSATDRVFVEELVGLWWGREARVDCARIRCCGISVL